MNRLTNAHLALAAALAGLHVVAANSWGAPTPGPCQDTVTDIIGLCVGPRSPAWALALGALLPALAATVVGTFWRRRLRRTLSALHRPAALRGVGLDG